MLKDSSGWDKVKNLWTEVWECENGCGPAMTDPDHPVCDLCRDRLSQMEDLVDSLWKRRS